MKKCVLRIKIKEKSESTQDIIEFSYNEPHISQVRCNRHATINY
jgi:hypothetical protein